MVDGFNQVSNDHLTASEAQRHADMAEAAKRAGQHYQSPTKPPSQAWDRLYSIARIAAPVIAVVGLLAMAGFAVWVVVSSG